MIDNRVLVSRRIGVESFSLDVGPRKRLIVVIQWLRRCQTDNVLVLRLEWLQSFKCVVSIEANIINVFMLGWVVLDALVEASKGVVHHNSGTSAIDELFYAYV